MKCIGLLVVRGSPGRGDYLIMMQLNRSHLQFTKSIISSRKHLMISSCFQVRGWAISCHWRMWPSALSPCLGYPGQKLRGRVPGSQIWHQLRGFCSQQQIHCVCTYHSLNMSETIFLVSRRNSEVRPRTTDFQLLPEF